MSLLSFSNERKNIDKLTKIPPPPFALSVSKRYRISILENTVRVCVAVHTIGGMDNSVNALKPFSPLVGKKPQGHFLTQKESAWLISVDFEQLV